MCGSLFLVLQRYPREIVGLVVTLRADGEMEHLPISVYVTIAHKKQARLLRRIVEPHIAPGLSVVSAVPENPGDGIRAAVVWRLQ